MTNKDILKTGRLLLQLLELHDVNPHKIKTYARAERAIEQLQTPLATMTKEELLNINGIGEFIATQIDLLCKNQSLPIMEEYLAKTPSGVLAMLNVKGLGIKKIKILWQEHQMLSIEDILIACEQNKISGIKGFGTKSQENLKTHIRFLLQQKGKYLFASVNNIVLSYINKWNKLSDGQNQHSFFLVGDLKRQMPIIEKVACISTKTIEEVHQIVAHDLKKTITENSNEIVFQTLDNIVISIQSCTKKDLPITLFKNYASTSFLEHWLSCFPESLNGACHDYAEEPDIFKKCALPYIPIPQREQPYIIQYAQKHERHDQIVNKDIRGIIHCHTTWSDGGNTLEEMADACIKKGYEYMVITDHSQAAFYAHGLQPNSILQQHQAIDALNKNLAPFHIFKGIECDILLNGQLDYHNDILASFDFVIGSIHSNLDMAPNDAMDRLHVALENPYLNMLGHLTGRLLLKRQGYIVNHLEIIRACARKNIVIELNANPKRLDIDWTWLDVMVQEKVMTSINPDAHSIADIDNCQYGIAVAQKTLITKANNLSSFSLQEFKNYLEKRSM